MPLNSVSGDLKGWLLDAEPASGGMTVWIKTEDGLNCPVLFPFSPRFCLSGSPEILEGALRILERANIRFSHQTVEKWEFMSGEPRIVREIAIADPMTFSVAVRLLTKRCESLSFYDSDIPLPQKFFYETGLFPLAFVALSVDTKGRLRESACLDSPWSTDYRLPELRIVTLAPEEERGHPRYGFPPALAIGTSDGVRVLNGEEPALLLETLNTRIRQDDPDLLLTSWGDDWIFPGLYALSARTGIPLELSRTAVTKKSSRKARTWFSYGKVHFRPGACLLSGRWHIDRTNSFILKEAGLDGLFEQARLTRIPVQEMARTSTGTGITSLQLALAVRKKILIPWRKNEPESFGTALELLETDKGGMVFLPPPGFHESVAELDFASMYPSLMVRFNISPETVGCSCCPGNRAPGTRHTVCTRRSGFIPEVLAPLLEKRQIYKDRLAKRSVPHKNDPDNLRQKALKWLLVVSFGYLGYKNARFGRIEAHECVTAYGREVLLKAKEMAEDRGFRVLHGIVDSLWIQKQGMTRDVCEELAREIGKETGIPLNLEGIYRWIGFFSSRTSPSIAVPNRFLGVFKTGEIKVRGLEIRRRDAPPFVRQVQQKMLDILARAENMEEYRRLIPKARSVLEEALEVLSEGRVPLSQLVFRKTLSRSPAEFERATITAIVSRELLGRGICLAAGETVHYVLTDVRNRDPAERARAWPVLAPDVTYDRKKYRELILRAAEPLLNPREGSL
ncbi:DNA polymerase domain-containing protein [Leptospirillum ferriphilum]|uniref:DNA polymerase domain-containing protein n=1 Tax=Leptospirillum ferriphilum TaxID=178606 RepID=UPI000AADD036|nr:DNA polymerase domain-containing protein [Leptospirillum ferriphilum]